MRPSQVVELIKALAHIPLVVDGVVVHAQSTGSAQPVHVVLLEGFELEWRAQLCLVGFIRRFLEHLSSGRNRVFGLHFHRRRLQVFFAVVFLQRDQDVRKGMVLLLYFLMVASALISSPSADEVGHRLEDFVEAPHLLVEEVRLVLHQKHKVQLLLQLCPMPSVHSFEFLVPAPTLPFLSHSFRRFIFVLDCFKLAQ